MRDSTLTAAAAPMATGRNPPTPKAAKKAPAKKPPKAGRNPPTGKPKN